MNGRLNPIKVLTIEREVNALSNYSKSFTSSNLRKDNEGKKGIQQGKYFKKLSDFEKQTESLAKDADDN